MQVLSSRPVRLTRFLFLVGLIIFGYSGSGWSLAKVYLTDGETRLGTVIARDGRVTIVSVDRLYQFPEEAVYRIDHVSGETALVASPDVFIREKPEPFAQNLAAIPKGCEVRVLGYEGDWTQIEVYGGRDLASGYIQNEHLAETVAFDNPIAPTVRFKDPPPDQRDRVSPSQGAIDLMKYSSPYWPLKQETSFAPPPLETGQTGGLLDLTETGQVPAEKVSDQDMAAPAEPKPASQP